ncbi:hypothetical protein AVBRAN12640_00020 [Campylobacter sp. RM12640]|uniref:hypothetical protein n=1 Tax=unclassified Campylobacter TaxID=2593542 RepID=UPI00301472EC|nr:hypothetical protein [Campylobacter sp. RM12640]MBZ7988241.1 hypothetical protein [Campylobacter sp. RM12635]
MLEKISNQISILKDLELIYNNNKINFAKGFEFALDYDELLAKLNDYNLEELEQISINLEYLQKNYINEILFLENALKDK